MSSLMLVSLLLQPVAVALGDEIGALPAGERAFGRQRLPTDPVGVFTLTLTNLVVGSAIQVEPQAGGSALYSGTASASTAVIPLQAYAAGSSSNDLRIKVRKGTASPFYQPFETQATAGVGAQTIFVSQIPDE
jgi:hypothetical protein